MTPRHLVIPLFLAFCLLLGGASAAGFLPNLTLQLLALPIIVLALLKPQHSPAAAARTLTLLAAAMILLVLVQLIPLPPAIWLMLPGREPVADGFTMLGQPLPWMPISMSPDRTVAALLWLLPALAAMLGILRLGAYRSAYLAWVLAGVTVLAVVVGAMQLTGGSDSPFYFYAITNWGYAVGFFANSNHMATLLLATIPFLAALQAEALTRYRSIRQSSGITVILVGTAMIVVVGLAINQSLAGWGLAVPVIGGSLLLVRFRARSLPVWAPIVGGVLTAMAVAAIFWAPLGSGPFSQDARSSSESRATSVGITAEEAIRHLPLGSGIGTFVQVYRTRENPRTIERTYMNHAHSDVTEIALEAGLPGLILLAVFLIWWGRRTWKLWGASGRPDHYARAATIASAAVLAHSMVDYPLRTAAISTLFAVCLALMTQPRPVSRAPDVKEEAGVRHLSA